MDGREKDCDLGLYPRHQLWGSDALQRHGYSVETIPSVIGTDNWMRRLLCCLTAATRLRLGNMDQEFQAITKLRPYDAIYGVSYQDIFLLTWLRKLKLINAKILVWAYTKLIKMPRLHELVRPETFYRGIDGVLCLTQKAVDGYAKIAPQAVVRKIDWGADLDMFQPRNRVGEYFLACGRSQRDYDTLLKAAAKIRFPIKLIIPKSVLSKTPLPPNVEFIGGPNDPSSDRGIPYREFVDPHLANCRAVLVPLLEDCNTSAGFTNSIEAFAVAKPVIMTRTGCLDLDLANTGSGLYVESGDVDGWVRAMNLLAADPALAQEMGRRGRNRAEVHFNSERFGRDVCKFFDLCIYQ